jgi:hypothetical protein
MQPSNPLDFVRSSAAALLSCLVLVGCGSASDAPVLAAGGSSALPGGGGSAQTPGAGGASTGAEFRSLIEIDWSLPPATEKYICGWVTVSEDMYIDAFAPENPRGTHHTGLTVADDHTHPDGVEECDITTLGRILIFGAGLGTQVSYNPKGVAALIPAGTQLLLNLHLFNTTDVPMTGRSGTRGRLVDRATVEQVSEGVAAGPILLLVPPGRSTQRGTCTFEHDATMFRITPHMHQTGVHMRVVAHSSTRGDVTVHDAPFQFDTQLTYPLDMIPMRAGDKLDVECTYENATGRTLSFGESSTDEMCLAGIQRFPRQNGSASCFF